MTEFSADEAKILNAVQRSFPLMDRPFWGIAEETGIGEEDALTVIKDLKDRGVIRNIAGIFNGESLGYHLSLVALKVPAGKVEEAAVIINGHPGVSHNYLRDHSYNIWFTLAEENEDLLGKSAKTIAEKSGAEDWLMLRNERLYKIGFMLNIGDDNGSGPGEETAKRREPYAGSLTDTDREAVFLLQSDLPLEMRPFDALAGKSEVFDGTSLIEAGRRLLEMGVMRRYAAVLRHKKAGFTHNAMTAWKPGQDKDLEERIRPFMEERAVTHLYMRTLYPGKWEHQLFAMVHARSEEELEGILEGLSRASGIGDRLVLRSLHEYKKKKVIYFSPEFTEWKRLNYD